ncbi:MAG: hypothetical protein V4437_01245 [Patescibacteria group bacterium]
MGNESAIGLALARSIDNARKESNSISPEEARDRFERLRDLMIFFSIDPAWLSQALWFLRQQ